MEGVKRPETGWMRWLRTPRRKRSDVGTMLRRARPEPRPEFLASLAERTRPERRPALVSAPRLALAGTLSAIVLAALASVGGLGYAASQVEEAAKAVKRLVYDDKVKVPGNVGRPLGAGGDQYQPGFGWGDPNYNHAGPPRLRARNVQVRSAGPNLAIRFRLSLSEQADLFVGVVGPGRGRLGLPPNGLQVQKAVARRVKTLRYRVLVPRVLNIRLLVPKQELKKGKTYRIQIRAKDPAGESSRIVLTFRA